MIPTQADSPLERLISLRAASRSSGLDARLLRRLTVQRRLDHWIVDGRIKTSLEAVQRYLDWVKVASAEPTQVRTFKPRLVIASGPGTQTAYSGRDLDAEATAMGL